MQIKRKEKNSKQDIKYQEREPSDGVALPKDYFENLAHRSGFGDVHAMWMLGEWFRGKLSDAYLELESEWENSPIENREKLSDYLKENEEEAFNARAGIMWFMRAAAYGNAQAVELVSKHEHWNALSLFPEMFFYPGTNIQAHYNGKVLRKAGLFDFKENQTYYINSIDSDGIFCAETDGGYEGPDEDGFGMEELYNFHRFDEFFHDIGCLWGYSHLDYRNSEESFKEKLREKKEVYRQQREAYWKDRKLSEKSEQYKWLTSEYSGAMIRNGVLMYYGEDGQKEYIIPQTVTVIGRKAFSRNRSLQEIVVPETVQCIEAGAFSNCKSLKRLKLPNHLTTLGVALCFNSRNLEEIKLPENLIELPVGMFKFNQSMKQIKLPENLKKIQAECFSYSDIQDISFPEGLEEICQGAFINSGISKIDIPINVKIGEEVFYGCDKLREVVISEGITEIEKGTFKSCSKLKFVKLPFSLKKIHSDAFHFCESLIEITIPESVEYIGYNAFPKGVIIYGKTGTEAEKYAHEENHQFISIE